MTKYWPNHVFAFLLSIMEVNMNLAATYFCGHVQMSQIEFCKVLVKTTIITMKRPMKCLTRSARLAIVLSCSPHKFFWGGHKSLLQIVHIHNTSVQPEKKGMYLLSLLSWCLSVCPNAFQVSPCLPVSLVCQ